MSSDMPRYTKRSGLMAGLLLIPFFAALTANMLDRIMYGHTLYGSWLWKSPIIGLWILYLPEAALMLALAGYATYVFRGKSSWLQRLWMSGRPGRLLCRQ
ncbi:MAG TPA: hypothetical protein VGS08_04095 [Candidatus Saccharimonadales bacterium]|nr:hypothetical protein [Candidatus Saccharimonadales bacterium]